MYHTSASKFTEPFPFKEQPTWFSITEKDAAGWHNSSGMPEGTYYTYICSFIGPLSSIENSRQIALRVWPNDKFIYSMFDKKIGEFNNKDIDQFISLLVADGFQGSYLEDYDPNNFEGTTTAISIIVFNASQVRQIGLLY